MSFLHSIRRCTAKMHSRFAGRSVAGGEAVAALVLLAATACQQEELHPAEEPAQTTGRILLTPSETGLFTDVETRATQTLTDFTGYVFTLNGTTDEGEEVVDRVVDLVPDANGLYTATLPSGTYYLTADNFEDAASGIAGKPYYSGKSADFSVAPATTVPVSLHLGAPKNACITYLLDDSFAALYAPPTFTIHVDGSDILLSAPATSATDLTHAAFCHVATSSSLAVIYNSHTARTLNYTLAAQALPGSHVTDVTSTGSVTVTSGIHTLLTLRADPVTGEVIPFVTGEHNGVFD